MSKIQFKNKFYDSSKLNLIKDIQSLLNEYLKLVLLLEDMFITQEEINKILKEIQILETLIQSKMKISSLMRGY